MLIMCKNIIASCILIVYSDILPNSLISSSNYIPDFVNNIPPANKFTSYSLIFVSLCPFLTFSYGQDLHTRVIMGFFFLVPNLYESIQILNIKCNVSPRFFLECPLLD